MKFFYFFLIKYNEVLKLAKELPKVYAVPITKKINNNEEMYFSEGNNRSLKEEKGVSITDINKIFNAKDHVYKSKVEITTSRETKVYEIVGMSKNSLLTLEGNLIPISEIKAIKKVS